MEVGHHAMSDRRRKAQITPVLVSSAVDAPSG
jgi:hypothetical protein